MSEKKTQKTKEFKPLEIAVNDAIETGFFGDKYFKIDKLIAFCKQRGLNGIWEQKDLSKPLNLFCEASKDEEAEKIDAALTDFATAIGFDVNLVKRHYYSIKQNWELQFLKSEQDAAITFDETPAEEGEETEETNNKPADAEKLPKEKSTKDSAAATAKSKQQVS